MPLGKASIILSIISQKFEAGMKRVQDAMKRVQETMKKTAERARNVLVVGGGALAGFLKLAGDQQESELALQTALQNTGQSVDVWVRKLREAASEIQEVTRYGDEMVLSLQATAINMGVAAEEVDSVVKAAIGLSAAFNIDVNSALRNYLKLQSGLAGELGELDSRIRNAATAAERIAVANEIAANGFKQAQDKAGTFNGRLEQMKNALGDLGEVVGNIWLPRVTEMIERITEAVPAMQTWVQQNAKTIETFVKLGAAIAAVLFIIPKVAATVSTLATVFAAVSTGITYLIAGLTAAKASLLAFATNPVVLAVAAIGALIIAIEAVRGKIRELEQAMDDLSARSRDSAETFKKWKDARDALKNASTLEEQAAALNTIIESTEKLRQEQIAEAKLLRRRGKDFEDAAKQAERYAEKLQAANEKAVADRDKILNKLREQQREEAKKAASAEEYAKQLAEIETKIEALKMGEEKLAEITLRKSREAKGLTPEQIKLLELKDKELDREKQLAAAREAAKQKQQESLQAAKDRIQALGEEIAKLTGATDDSIELEKLKESLGETSEEYKRINELLKERARLTKQRGLEDEGKSLTEAVRTNEELLAIERQRIQTLLQAKVITQETADRALKAAQERYAEEQKIANIQFEGLQQTFKRIQRAAATPRSEDRSASMTAQNTSAIKTQSEKTNSTLLGLLDQFRNAVTVLHEIRDKDSLLRLA